jgi:hypothetical protein
MTLTAKRILVLALAVLGTCWLLVPLRLDVITGYYQGETPETSVLVPMYQELTSTVIQLDTHPASKLFICLFAFAPCLLVWKSFSIRKPFTLPTRALMQLSGLVLFLGAAYTMYIITYKNGGLSMTECKTSLTVGGILLAAQNFLTGAYIFSVVGIPDGKHAALFEYRDASETTWDNQMPRPRRDPRFDK